MFFRHNDEDLERLREQNKGQTISLSIRGFTDNNENIEIELTVDPWDTTVSQLCETIKEQGNMANDEKFDLIFAGIQLTQDDTQSRLLAELDIANGTTVNIISPVEPQNRPEQR